MVLVNLVLLAAVGAAIVAVQAWDRPETAVEASVRRYATAVSTGDFEAAMAEIAPSARPTWDDWVRSQVGNVYAVTGIAVRADSLLAAPSDVTVDLDVNRGYADDFYQASPRVAVVEVDGHWYLAAPLLAPTPEL